MDIPNFPNRTFAVMDNLPFLERLPDESVDLINIDPPFGKMEAFRREAKPPITEIEKAEERALFLAHGLSLDDEQQRKQLMVEGGSLVDDIFTWGNDVSGNHSHKAFYDRIAAAEDGSMASRVHRVIEAVREIAGDNQAAYVCFMAVRLVHCHRVLKPTGSIYVHCDWKSDSHLRMLLDAIFGVGAANPRNRQQAGHRNVIAWCYTGPGSPGMRQFNRKHDTILWYSKGSQWTFNRDDVRVPHKDGGPHAGGFPGASREPNDPSYGKEGKVPETWWVMPIAPRFKSQYMGYATQKPLDLAKRIIEASSNPGDLVMDLFAGCATTLVAAEVTGRHWIGCDWAYRAWTMNKRRFVSIPDEHGGPMRLSGTTDVTLRALGLEGAQIPFLESVTIGPPDLEGLPSYSIEGMELAVASASRRDPTWTGLYSKDEAKEIMLREFGPVCWGCAWAPTLPNGQPDMSYLHVDHSLARHHGGDDELANLGLLCPRCNGRKGSREIGIAELRAENDADGLIYGTLAELQADIPLVRWQQRARELMDKHPRSGVGADALGEESSWLGQRFYGRARGLF